MLGITQPVRRGSVRDRESKTGPRSGHFPAPEHRPMTKVSHVVWACPSLSVGRNHPAEPKVPNRAATATFRAVNRQLGVQTASESRAEYRFSAIDVRPPARSRLATFIRDLVDHLFEPHLRDRSGVQRRRRRVLVSVPNFPPPAAFGSRGELARYLVGRPITMASRAVRGI